MKLSGSLLALAVVASATLVACDNNSNVDIDTSPVSYTGEIKTLTDTLVGVFDADGNGTITSADTVFLNVGGTVTGSYDVAGNFDITVTATGLSDGTHAMHIHGLGSCPTDASDTNSDGVVDVIEGFPSYGGVLIPLDNNIGDLSSNEFPMASGGVLSYNASVAYTSITESLRRNDPDGDVQVIAARGTGASLVRRTALGTLDTLSVNEPLRPLGRVVVIHGVDPTYVLPETVGTLGALAGADTTRLPATATIPVACAELTLPTTASN